MVYKEAEGTMSVQPGKQKAEMGSYCCLLLSTAI